jgi:murein DD-endopeptidase MepM/ murein hydrolase activator NlpD
MTSNTFNDFTKQLSATPLQVLDNTISKSQYIPIDLSINNTELLHFDVSSSTSLATYINSYIKKHKATVAYGGYIEARNIYNRSTHFNKQNPDTERNIHLGLDLWLAEYSPIFAPLESTVHSFKNNTNYGDYGPTIILEHQIKNVTFYTLYGHLSEASLINLYVGKKIKKGEQIATLGDASINGDYPPHLHFQIIKDIDTYKGDYPGVCNQNDLEFYKQNCPDPNNLLKL